MANTTSHYVILDRSDPYGPLWVLAVRVDRTGWRSATDRPAGWMPADLDPVGQPAPDEQGRLVQWVTVALDRQVALRPLPGGGHVYRVVPVVD